MANDIVVNGETYQSVESVALTDSKGDIVQFYPDAVRYVAQELSDEQKAQARQNIGIEGELTEIKNDLVNKEPLHKVLSATLVTGEITLTFTDDAITDNAMVYIYTDVWGVQPSTVEQSGNTLTLTFDAQSADLGVKVEVR